MPWIQIIEEAESTGKLKEIHTEIEKKRGKISNIMKRKGIIIKPIISSNHKQSYNSN